MLKPSKPNQSSAKHPLTQGDRACSKCGSSKMALSQLEKYDSLKIRLLGKQPYRCMRCYHRAWFNKTSAKGHTMSKIIVVLALLVMSLSVYTFFFKQPVTPSVSVIASSNSTATQKGAQNAEQSAPSLASLINMPEQNDSAESHSNISSSRIDHVDPQVDQLNPEQQAALLLQAKNQSEAAEQLSRARVEQLKSVLLPVDDELESLVKVEVGYVVDRWRKAWATGSIDDYLASYGADFVPSNNLSLATWKQQRRSRVTPQKQIELSLSKFDIAMSDDLSQSTVDFNQRYQSGSYIESSRKRLTLEKESGTWKIVGERELQD